MVGRLPLEEKIVVRIPVPEQNNKTALYSPDNNQSPLPAI
jgi:hypothetical protein